MLQRAITPQISSQIIDLLTKKRGWSIAKIAKRINASREYIMRIHRAAQNFEFADVEILAQACRQDTHAFVFDAMQPAKMTAEQRDLYQLTQNLIDSHKDFVRASRRSKPKKILRDLRPLDQTTLKVVSGAKSTKSGRKRQAKAA